MTDTETRLRGELPQLADWLLDAESQGRPADVAPLYVDKSSSGSAPRSLLERAASAQHRSRAWLGMAAGLVLVAGAVGLALVGDERLETGAAKPPATAWGAWEPLPDAPIGSRRAYPVAVWTGEQVVFWGGTNLARNWADTGGAAFDPATDIWSEVTGPSWGHPGLAGAFSNGHLYLVAKGGGSRFAFGEADSDDLPHVDGMSIVAAVATDDGLWVMGPAAPGSEARADLGIARYDPASDAWRQGPAHSTPKELHDFATLTESPPVWTGSEIVVWNPVGSGAAFDPVAGTWRDLPELSAVDGTIVTSTLVATDGSVVVLAEIDEGATTTTGVASLDDGEWTWRSLDLPATDLDRSTAVGAGELILVLRADDSPIAIDPVSGAWHVFDDSPVLGVEAPGAVWTGEQLVVWGGIPSTSASNDAPGGAIWTPSPSS